METINNTDKAPALRSTVNANFTALGSGYAEIYATDKAPAVIQKLNENFALAEQQGSGGGGSTIVVDGPINVKTDFGATGNGTTDDTVSLENAFAAAYTYKRPVYFPAGTYLIRRPLILRSGMEIYGDGSTSVIKKKAAVWHKLTVATTINSNELTLDSVEGFSVGDAFYITSTEAAAQVYNGRENARTCTYGIIKTIDTVNNKITFDSNLDYVSGYSGAIKAHPVNCLVSTSYSVFRSWSKWECVDVRIHDLKLDGNRQGIAGNGEPVCWCNSVIHFDPYSNGSLQNVNYKTHSYNHIIYNCTIVNSSCDGISDQGEGALIVTGCTFTECKMHGVHTGTTFSGAIVKGCTMSCNSVTNLGAGIFWCQGVTDMVVLGNSVTLFNKGCSDKEFGSGAKYSLIRGNTFTGIKSYVFDFSIDSTGAGLCVINNTIKQLKSQLFYGNGLSDVMVSGNKVESITTLPSTFITVTNCKNVLISGNERASGNIATDVDSTGTTNILNVPTTIN